MSLLDEVRIPAQAAGRTTIDGSDPVLAARFPIGMAAATALAGCATVAALLWRDRTGRTQDVLVDIRRAAASLVSYTFQRLEDPLAAANPRSGRSAPGALRRGCGRPVWRPLPIRCAPAHEVLGRHVCRRRHDPPDARQSRPAR